jgi:hypothetical protein
MADYPRLQHRKTGVRVKYRVVRVRNRLCGMIDWLSGERRGIDETHGRESVWHACHAWIWREFRSM